jgi:two-component system CheB/CheR fusion protein
VNDDLNNFVYVASHDLNAPIVNIEMIMDLLNEKINLRDAEIAGLSGMISSSINKFKSVVKDLARIGVLEAELLEECEIESFADIFEEITATISEKVKLAGAVFTADFRETHIRFPKKNLRSIMLNLLTNALKFKSPGVQPKIMVKTEKSGDFTLLTVKDNGVGIAEDRIDFIFKMYQRISEDIEGQGIGLYLLKKIVNASGGKIEVESEAGKGSTFKIFFKAY